MTTKTLQALIFDVDGTLADTERDGHRVAFNAAFEEYGLPWVWDVPLYGELLEVTGGKERIRRFADQHLETKDIPDNFDALVPELHAAKTKHYTELLSTGAIPLRSGVQRLLNEAHNAGLRLAIATTTTPENVTALLTHTLGADSIELFEVISAGDIVPAKKPAPDIYTYALEKMNLDPKACLAFEDSYNGIRSSIGADLATIITINDYTQDHDFTGAEIVLDKMGEPDEPFHVISGNAFNHNHLNLPLLHQIHSHAISD